MRATGPPGRGERGRIERRLREALGHWTADASGCAEPGDLAPAAPPSQRPASHRAPSSLLNLISRAGVRADPGRRAALAVAGCLAVVLVLAVFWVLSARPHTMALGSGAGAAPPTRSPVAMASTPASDISATAGALVVDVVGKVHRPGIYRLASGSRVDDAVHAAGGALPGVALSGVNLAARLVDGQQIAIATPGAAAGGAGSAGGAVGSSALVDVNTADLEQLQTLPGVGPVLAQNILDYRGSHGALRGVDQLNDVPGIGPTKFAALRTRVTT